MKQQWNTKGRRMLTILLALLLTCNICLQNSFIVSAGTMIPQVVHDVASVLIEGDEVPTNYSSLPEAVEAVTGKTATITLLDDVTLFDNYIDLTGDNIILDLNGKTITHNSKEHSKAIVTDGNITIKDSTHSTGGIITDTNSAVWAYSGTLTIEGGTYSANSNIQANRSVYSGCSTIYSTNAFLNITGGTFKASNAIGTYQPFTVLADNFNISNGDFQNGGLLALLIDEEDSTVVSGGTFGGIQVASIDAAFNMVASGSKDALTNYSLSNLMLDGYGLQKIDNTWADLNAYNILETVTAKIPPKKNVVTINNGTGDGDYTEGSVVTITADAAPLGEKFDKWEVVSGGVQLASATNAETTFEMPAEPVEITAIYKKLETTVIQKKEPISIAKATVSGISNKNYTGKAQIQSSLKLKIGTSTLKPNIDYVASYSNNKNVGTSTITIKGKGKYTGTIKKTFRITLSKGKTYTINSMKYKVTNANTKGKGTVTLTGTTRKKTDKKFKSLSIGSTIKIGGISFKITAVGNNAFKGYTQIKKATIGSNLTTIGKSTFYNCKQLSRLTINSTKLSAVGSKSITNIKKNAVIDVPNSKIKAYIKLFKSSTGFKKTMKMK